MQPPISTYREFAPPAALAEHVLCVWRQAIGAGEACHPQRVLPDGCADIVWIGDAAPVVAGPATRPVIVPLPPATTVVGIRFRPGCAPAARGVPASDLLDCDTPLRDLWGAAADALSAEVFFQPGASARLALATAALGRRLGDARPVDPVVKAAVAWLAGHPEGRIEDLARAFEISQRQLGRRFAAAVGYGPKTFQRILRLQRALALAGRLRREGTGLAALAAETGYADQAHMTREIKALAGRSPATLLEGARSTLEMSDFFKTVAGPGA